MEAVEAVEGVVEAVEGVVEVIEMRSGVGGYCAVVSEVRGMLSNQDRGL